MPFVPKVNRNTFLRLYERIGPYWGTVGFWGRRLFGTWTMVLGDFVSEASRQTTRHRWPWEESPLDSLEYLGADRGLPQYPSEEEADYRNRIAPRASGGAVPSVWDQHEQKVSPAGLRDQLLAATYDVEIVEPDTDPATALAWSEYGLRIHGYGEQPCTPLDWDLPAWDSGWAWDTTLPASVCREIRDVCLTCAPTRSQLVSLRCPDLGVIPGVSLAHRWRADAGVTTSGGGVTFWEDTIGGITLERNLASTYTFTSEDPDFNDRPSIAMPAGMTSTVQLSPTSDDWTVCVICYPDAFATVDRRIAELTDVTDALGLAPLHATGSLEVGSFDGATVRTTGVARVDEVPTTYVVVADASESTTTIYRDGVLLGALAYTPFTPEGLFTLGGATSAATSPLLGKVVECGLAWQAATDYQAGRMASYARDYYAAPFSGNQFSSPWEVTA